MSTTVDTCPVCGAEYLSDAHVERCRRPSLRGTDTCPTRGEPYDSCLEHLRRCEAS